MAIEAGDIVWKILGDLDGIESAFDDAKKQAEAKFGAVSNIVGGAMTAMGGTIVAALGGATKATIDYGSALVDSAAKTGLTVEATAELKHAAEQSGASLGTVETAMKRLSSAVTDARTGNETALVSFDALGLSVESFAGLTPDQIFMQVAQAVSQIEDPMMRSALAQDLFGKSGTELLPMLAGGAEGIQAMRIQAQELGLVMGAEAAAQAEAFGDQVDQLKGTLMGLAIEIGPIVIEVLGQLIEWMKSAVIGMREWVEAHPVLTEWIVKIGGALGMLMLALGPLIMMLPGLIAAFSMVGPVLGVVGTALVALATGPIGIVVAAIAGIAGAAWYWWDDIKAAFSDGTESVGQSSGEIADAMQSGTEQVSPILEGFRAFFANIWGSIVSIAEYATQGIILAFNAVVQPVQYVIGLLMDAYDWMASIPMLSGLADGIGGVPAFADGGTMARSGWAMVGERGPELVRLPGRSTVYDAEQTAGAMAGGGGGSTVNLNISFGRDSVRSDRDIEDIERKIAETVRRDLRGLGFA